MSFEEIQPIHNAPILLIKHSKTLVAGDFHIGIESELREYGIHVAPKTMQLQERLLSFCKIYQPQEIVLLGDIKHNIPSSTVQERHDVTTFLETLQRYATIHIVPGNHDGQIIKLSPQGIRIHPSNGVVIGDIGFVHGHRWPKEEIMQCKYIIMGHSHPTIMLTDRLGYKTYEPCWLRGTFTKNKLRNRYSVSANPKLLIIPAFNPLCGGIAVNKEGIVGPLGKIINTNQLKIYLLNGSYLGLVKDVK